MLVKKCLAEKFNFLKENFCLIQSTKKHEPPLNPKGDFWSNYWIFSSQKNFARLKEFIFLWCTWQLTTRHPQMNEFYANYLHPLHLQRLFSLSFSHFLATFLLFPFTFFLFLPLFLMFNFFLSTSFFFPFLMLIFSIVNFF